jgi:GNAT superfamily N-acetyltransferase
MVSATSFTFKPLSPETWDAFEKLFGPKGPCAGCWCMTWRLRKAEYDKLKGEGNRKEIKKLVSKNESIGVLAFDGGKAVGWRAIAPREKYVRLQKSRVLKPVDEKPVWSVSCFFIAKSYHRKGLSVRLLKETVMYAKQLGADIIEGYPVKSVDGKMPDVFAWTGLLPTFLKAGFKQVKAHSPSRPIMRFYW